ncbi:hypothetical protein EDD22DRAFT_978916 [Suillus occidentalis]|nr:hypothetical protein EDD22DRAFT_978916 [Suillus occidentalis]
MSHPNDITNNPFQDDEFLGQLNGDDDEALQASPPPNVHTEFFGLGNSLYHNYHILLNKFETAEFFYIKNQMLAGQIDHLLDLGSPPFADHKDLYAIINSITLGDMKWEGFSCTYTGKKPDGYPPWMDGTYGVWYQDPWELVLNMLVNLVYANEMNYWPYHEYATNGDEWQLRDFISANWAWNQAMTVSVVMGNNEYYPLYLSIRNIHNNVHLISFLAMPKTTKKHADDPKFCKFHCQLFHSLLYRILASLQPGMSEPEIAKFGDGHFQCVIYGLGPYIANYEKQGIYSPLLVCSSYHDNLDATSPFTNDFPCADIHEIMAPDILHQVIKGTFEDHLVDWVEKYLMLTHGRTKADHILHDIDHRIAAIASFSGLCHFPQGRSFEQWRGNDSKALMKVYIPMIESHVPTDVVCAFYTLLEFCYLHTLDEIQDAVSRFHQYSEVFKTSGLSGSLAPPMDFAHQLPRAKHIKAVKELWRWSSKYKVLGQMLVTNQCLSKLAAACVDFESCGMLKGTCLSAELEALGMSDNPEVPNDEDPNDPPPNQFNAASYTETKCAHNVLALADKLHLPSLPTLICCFPYKQIRLDNTLDMYDIPLAACPRYKGKISVFNSVCSRFYVPSDLSRISDMQQNEFPRHDWFRHFSFNYAGTVYLCAVVCWFDIIRDLSDPEMEIWVFRPAYNTNCAPTHTIIHVDTIYHAAHLIPIYSNQFLPLDIMLYVSYDYIDHHAFEIAS